MGYLDILKAQLVVDEGKRYTMYFDSRKIPTVGIGHDLQYPISDRAVQVIFEDDVAEAETDARKLVSTFDSLSDVRKAVVINMSFNLGYGKLSRFKNTLHAIAEQRWGDAADGMLDSLWASQVGKRAEVLAQQMRTG